MEEDVAALTSLGLTQVQSKVFLALAKLRVAPINRISATSAVPRQDIYRVVEQLQELSLVQKLLTKPVTFQAASMDDACAILFRRKREEYLKLKHLNRQFLLEFNAKHKCCIPKKQEPQFIVVKGKEAVFKCYNETIEASKRNVDVATTQQRFLQSLNHLGNLYKKTLQKGVQCRIVVEKPLDMSTLSRVEELLSFPNFQLKYSSNQLRAILAICDDAKALVPMYMDEALHRSPIMFTDHRAFLAMFHDYFAEIWRKAELFDAKQSLST